MSSSTPSQRSKRVGGGKGSGAANASNHYFSPSVPFAADRKHITQSAVKVSLRAGAFVDTKFYAFSRRQASGLVDRPKALYANSAILRVSAKYFEGLLGGGYREANVSSLDGSFPSEQESSTEEYDYMSDSDLDDEESIPVDETPLTTDTEQKPGLSSSVDETAESVANSTEDASTLATLVSGIQGRVIVIPDVAFGTLEALLFYLYTDEVAFAPLTSERTSKPLPNTVSAHGAPLCSAKSMYRIADKYGLDKLKEKAAAHIKTKLSAGNILPELFSTITSRHDDIRKVQVAYACQKTTIATVVSGISPYVARVVSGELAHCEQVLTELFLKMGEAVNSTSTQVYPKCVSCRNQFGQATMYCDNCGRNRSFNWDS